MSEEETFEGSVSFNSEEDELGDSFLRKWLLGMGAITIVIIVLITVAALLIAVGGWLLALGLLIAFFSLPYAAGKWVLEKFGGGKQ